MKKIILLLTFFVSSISVSHAGFYDKDYLEPVVLGGAMAFGAYQASSDGNEVAYAFVAFGIGYFIGSETNEYYKNKVNRHYMDELEEDKAEIARYRQFFIERAANGDTTIPYSLLTTGDEDSQKVNDSVISGSRSWSLEEY